MPKGNLAQTLIKGRILFAPRPTGGRRVIIENGGPRPFKLRRIIDLYTSRGMRVNDEYQRGAAWSLEQKQSLIDSLFRGYPLPLFYSATSFLLSREDGRGFAGRKGCELRNR